MRGLFFVLKIIFLIISYKLYAKKFSLLTTLDFKGILIFNKESLWLKEFLKKNKEKMNLKKHLRVVVAYDKEDGDYEGYSVLISSAIAENVGF